MKNGTAVDRKRVTAWVLYDFANSVYPAVITATIFSVYYARAIVGNDEGLGDLWWGRVMSASMLFVALSAPPLGRVADRAGVRKKMLFGYTYLCIVSVGLFVFLEPGMVLEGFVLAVLANIGFEGALVYYNAYLPDLAPRNRLGLISGVGFGVGYAGSFAGLLIALPLVNREAFSLTWLSVAVFFALFSLPTFLGLPPDRKGEIGVVRAAWEGITQFRELLGDVLQRRDLRRFLLAYFFYIDGVLTTIYFASIFASTTLGFEMSELILLFMVVQISALVGAFLLGKPTDVWGPKRVVDLTLVLWILVVIAAFFIQSKTTFFVLATVAGTGLGAIQAASRSFMAALIPDGKEAELFGFYALCGKSSSVLGPLVFGGVSFLMGGNQRIAVLSVAAFFVIGLVLLQRVRSPAIPPA